MKYDMVAFDLDGVIVAERSSWEWVHRHFEVDNTPNLEAFIDGKIDDMEFMRTDIALWREKMPDVDLDHIAGVLGKAKVTDGAFETIKALKQKGSRTCIISGGMDLLADKIGKECGVDKVMSNGLEADENGRLLGDGILRVELRNKAVVLHEILREFDVRPERCAAVGNSWVDVTMFDVAGFSIAFNPIDREVQEAADVVVKSERLTDILHYLI